MLNSKLGENLFCPTMAVQALRGPLRGMRVLELGSFIAGPYCASILGSFGAEVIKVEPEAGDQIRGWR